MTGYYPNIIFRIMWMFVTPISLLGILIYSIYDQIDYGFKYDALVGCVVSCFGKL